MSYKTIPWTTTEEPKFLRKEKKNTQQSDNSKKRNSSFIENKKIYKEVSKRIGKILQFYREKNGLSLRELHRKTNVCIAVISSMENGENLSKVESLLKVCIAAGVPLTEIMAPQIITKEWAPPILSCNKERKKRKQTFKLFGCIELRSPFKIN